MKKIEAIIREERLEAVKQALGKGGYFSMMVSGCWHLPCPSSGITGGGYHPHQ